MILEKNSSLAYTFNDSNKVTVPNRLWSVQLCLILGRKVPVRHTRLATTNTKTLVFFQETNFDTRGELTRGSKRSSMDSKQNEWISGTGLSGTCRGPIRIKAEVHFRGCSCVCLVQAHLHWCQLYRSAAARVCLCICPFDQLSYIGRLTFRLSNAEIASNLPTWDELDNSNWIFTKMLLNLVTLTALLFQVFWWKIWGATKRNCRAE